MSLLQKIRFVKNTVNLAQTDKKYEAFKAKAVLFLVLFCKCCISKGLASLGMTGDQSELIYTHRVK